MQYTQRHPRPQAPRALQDRHVLRPRRPRRCSDPGANSACSQRDGEKGSRDGEVNRDERAKREKGRKQGRKEKKKEKEEREMQRVCWHGKKRKGE